MRLVSIVLLALIVFSTAANSAEVWDVKSDTWVATDALGRTLPGYKECGPPRQGKFVSMFYLLGHGQHGQQGPCDITKILAANPENPQWGPVMAWHHWGESELGYYVSDDEYVMRKHINMLVNADIDMIFIDVTNGYRYTNLYMKLCKVLSKMRRLGVKTPQICFFANTDSAKVVTELYKEFYSKKLYPEHWFYWKGKPLMLASPDGLSKEIQDFFTFRQSWAWHDPNWWYKDGRDKWTFLDFYPQAIGWHDDPKKAEQISVTPAQHPVNTNTGRSYHNGKQPPIDRYALCKETPYGLYFAEQWKRVFEVDPEMVMISSWNEWAALRFTDRELSFLGKQIKKGETYFVDSYNREYNRDIEPMKGEDTDNYYYQMISYIRNYRGVRPPEVASKHKKIRIDGKFDDWTDVGPEFRDHIGDTMHRNHKGWGSVGTYVNTTGRNDFVRLKVARDSKNVYFYAETRQLITRFTDPGWMQLFIDIDSSHKSGWHGYDYLVNAKVSNARSTTIQKNLGGWKWSGGENISYRASGNKMELAIPRSLLGLAGRKDFQLDFHWADNIQKPNDIIEFAISGDSAPDRRFNYRYMTTSASSR
jgi:hypothetical protein